MEYKLLQMNLVQMNNITPKGVGKKRMNLSISGILGFFIWHYKAKGKRNVHQSVLLVNLLLTRAWVNSSETTLCVYSTKVEPTSKYIHSWPWAGKIQEEPRL